MVPRPEITVRDIPPPVAGAPAGQARPAMDKRASQAVTLREARAEFEREFIIRKLREFGGNISRTAEAIDVERSNLHRKIKALGVEAEE